MHKVTAKGILSQNNGMNIYRGCSHNCIYCDSRSRCYNMNHDFEDIEIKENCLSLLEQKLKSKKQKCMIGTGAMTDPYVPLEKDEKLMRGCLEIIERYSFGVSVLTKSDLVLRDIDLLSQINQKSKAVLQMTLTTYDDNLCKIVEPNVCVTSKRVDVLKKFDEYGIPTAVWLCPILPYINDTEENLLGILNYCKDANVKRIIHFGMGMTLREGNREYFYKMLDKNFPSLKEKYIKEFGNNYIITSKNHVKLNSIFINFCKKHNIEYSNKKIFEYLSSYENNIIQEKMF